MVAFITNPNAIRKTENKKEGSHFRIKSPKIGSYFHMGYPRNGHKPGS
jgi:hypothetical protein